MFYKQIQEVPLRLLLNNNLEVSNELMPQKGPFREGGESSLPNHKNASNRTLEYSWLKADALTVSIE